MAEITLGLLVRWLVLTTMGPVVGTLMLHYTDHLLVSLAVMAAVVFAADWLMERAFGHD